MQARWERDVRPGLTIHGASGMESSFFFFKSGHTFSWQIKQTTHQKLLTAVGTRWSFPSRMTCGTYEIMFHVMVLGAKSGYVLQHLNGFSRMCGSRKKQQWWVGGVYQLHVRGEAEWFFPLSHPPSLLTAVDLQARSPLYQRVLCLAAATLPRSALSELDHFGGEKKGRQKKNPKRRLSCTRCSFCNWRQQFYFSCLTCLGCVNENLVAHRLLNMQKKEKRLQLIFLAQQSSFCYFPPTRSKNLCFKFLAQTAVSFFFFLVFPRANALLPMWTVWRQMRLKSFFFFFWFVSFRSI